MKASLIDGPFRKADYRIFPTLVQVHNIDCDTRVVNAFLDDCDMETWPDDIGKGTTSSRQIENLLHINEFAEMKTP